MSIPWLPILKSKYVTFSFSDLLAKGPSNISVEYCQNERKAFGRFGEFQESDGVANPDAAIPVGRWFFFSFYSDTSDTMLWYPFWIIVPTRTWETSVNKKGHARTWAQGLVLIDKKKWRHVVLLSNIYKLKTMNHNTPYHIAVWLAVVHFDPRRFFFSWFYLLTIPGRKKQCTNSRFSCQWSPSCGLKRCQLFLGGFWKPERSASLNSIVSLKKKRKQAYRVT